MFTQVVISKLLDWIKSSPKLLLPISFATGLLLFGKPEFIKKLGLLSQKDNYQPGIGIIFLLSTSVLASHLFFGLSSQIKTKIASSRVLRCRQKRLSNLTEQEKEILKGYIEKGTRTQYFRLEKGGVVRGLESEHIIYQASNIGRVLEGFAFNMQSWAWEYLNKHPELLSPKKDK